MAYQSTTAADHVDYLAKLVTFLTTDAALVAANQDWALLTDITTPYTEGSFTVRREVYLRGPGLAGTDEIFVQFRVLDFVGAGQYMLHTRGAIQHNPALPWATQPGVSPEHFTPLIPSSIGCRFRATGRSAIAVAKCGNVYESAHAGLMLPNCRPEQYPYPLLIGGSTENNVATSSVSESNRSWPDPGNNALRLRWIDGEWIEIQNWQAGGGGAKTSVNDRNVYPYNSTSSAQSSSFFGLLRECPGGDYLPERLVLQGDAPYRGNWGEIDGAWAVPGFGLTPEASLSFDARNFIAIPNRYRTGPTDYWLLETA